MWLSGLGTDLQTKGSPVPFPVTAHAWATGQVPSWDAREATTHWCFSLSSSPSPPFSLKINKENFFKHKVERVSPRFVMEDVALSCGPGRCHVERTKIIHCSLNEEMGCVGQRAHLMQKRTWDPETDFVPTEIRFTHKHSCLLRPALTFQEGF